MTTPENREKNGCVYQFADFRLDSSERTLLRNGVPVPLTEKTFQVLRVLVAKGGHLVERSDLVQAVWKDTFIEEGNLTVTISMLRKALGDDRAANRYIETVAKRGYRFLPTVTCLRTTMEASDSASVPSRTLSPAAITALASPLRPDRANGPDPSNRLAPEPILDRRHIGKVAVIAALTVAISFAAHAVFSGESHPFGPQPVQRFIAIAPLTVEGSDLDDAPAGRSIAYDLVARLGNRTGLEALPIGEASAYSRGVSTKLPGPEVEALLTGTLHTSSDGMRAAVKLSNPDGRTIWSESFSVLPGQLQSLEDQVESAVSVQMFALASASHSASRARDFRAQRLYLAGRYFWNERTEDDLRRSIECFEQAIFRDAEFAEAYAGLADSYALLASYSVEPPFEAYPNAKTAAERALQLNAGLAEGHTALGIVALYYEWNWNDAGQQFKRAIELSPTDAASYSWNSLYFAAVGQTSAALEQAEKAHQMDGMSMPATMHLGSAYYWNRQFGKAADIYHQALAQNSNFARAHSRLGMVLTAEQDYPAAIREFRETERLAGSDPYTDALIGYAEARRGNAVAARRTLDDLTARSEHEYVPAFSFGMLYLGLGKQDEAMQAMERARQDKSTYLTFAKVDPLLDPLRADPRFRELLARMDLKSNQDVSNPLRVPSAGPSSSLRGENSDVPSAPINH